MIKLFLLCFCTTLSFSILAPCRRFSPDFNDCILKKIQASKAYFLEGAPELSIPSLKVIEIPYASTEFMGLRFSIWNYKLTGLEDIEVTKIDADFSNNRISAELLIRHGQGVGSCELKGNLLNLKLNNIGNIFVNGTNIIVKYTIKTKIVENEGDFHLKIISQEASAHVNRTFFIHLENLCMESSKSSTEAINDVLNENYQYLFQILAPLLENVLISKIGPGLESLFENYSYNELFPK